MKNLLPIHFFLFCFTALFTVKGVSQALPDPGVDPIDYVDSIHASRTIKGDVANDKTQINHAVPDSASKKMRNTGESSSNILEKPKQSLYKKA